MSLDRRHVVVAGAGVAGLETALALRALAADLVSVELVAPEADFVYRPSAVAEPFRMGEARRFPLERLVRAIGAEVRSGAVASLTDDEKLVTLADGDRLRYDSLVLAVGAQPREAVAGALTFRGAEDVRELALLLDDAVSGRLERIVFAIPPGATWPLPLYELALLTKAYLAEHMTRGVEIVLVTPEERPLALFGPAASEEIDTLLRIRQVRVETASVARCFEGGVLELAAGEAIPADAVVAVPSPEGPRIGGLPQDARGFVATDDLGWVLGLTDVYAAGDLTQSSIKQGGIAAQQADAVASAIAATAGAQVRPTAARPVLRGLLLTGLAPRFLRGEGSERRSVVDTQPLWWPPAKIVGRYLSPFLAEHLGLASEFGEPPRGDAVPVEVAVDTRDHAVWSTASRSARSETTTSAPCARSASAWPARSTPTT
jgi:sulfide:quinone oxidoreductase